MMNDKVLSFCKGLRQLALVVAITISGLSWTGQASAAECSGGWGEGILVWDGPAGGAPVWVSNYQGGECTSDTGGTSPSTNGGVESCAYYEPGITHLGYIRQCLGSSEPAVDHCANGPWSYTDAPSCVPPSGQTPQQLCSNQQDMHDNGTVCEVTRRDCVWTFSPNEVCPGQTPPSECPTTCSEVIETRYRDCPSGQTGQIRETRTFNTGGVCGAEGAWQQAECSCTSRMVSNPIQVMWAQFANNDGDTMFISNGIARNNCPAGWTQTELIDDGDSVHSLAEDHSSGRNRQLCIKTSDDNIKLTSVWAAGACPAGMTDTGLSDTYTSKTNRWEEKYMYRHELSEEDEGRDYWHWCLGLTPESVALGATLGVRASGSAYCNADEALLVHWHNNERNVNNEDGANNRALCVKVTSPSSTEPNVCTTTTPCSEVTDTQNGVCPAGYSGSIILERRRNRNGICGNDESEWRVREDTCTPDGNTGGGSGDPWDVDRGCFRTGSGGIPACDS